MAEVAFNGVNVIYLIPIILGAATSTYFFAKHFWLKTQCFKLMKQRLEHVEKDVTKMMDVMQREIETARETHIGMFKTLNAVQVEISELKGLIKGLTK